MGSFAQENLTPKKQLSFEAILECHKEPTAIPASTIKEISNPPEFTLKQIPTKFSNGKGETLMGGRHVEVSRGRGLGVELSQAGSHRRVDRVVDQQPGWSTFRQVR